MVRGRAVALLFGDDSPVPVELSAIGEVIAFAALAGASIERIIVRKKMARAGAPAARVSAGSLGELAKGARLSLRRVRERSGSRSGARAAGGVAGAAPAARRAGLGCRAVPLGCRAVAAACRAGLGCRAARVVKCRLPVRDCRVGPAGHRLAELAGRRAAMGPPSDRLRAVRAPRARAGAAPAPSGAMPSGVAALARMFAAPKKAAGGALRPKAGPAPASPATALDPVSSHPLGDRAGSLASEVVESIVSSRSADLRPKPRPAPSRVRLPAASGSSRVRLRRCSCRRTHNRRHGERPAAGGGAGAEDSARDAGAAGANAPRTARSRSNRAAAPQERTPPRMAKISNRAAAR
ncbi:MAG: hypothetical protein R3F14_22680 [Polyangiaceae bacterium]